MLSRFRLICCVIWTASLVCVMNGAPVVELNMLDKFLSNFTGCEVLDFVALPEFKSGEDGSVSNTDYQGNYDLSVPLETCTITTGNDKTAVPICNEAFDVIRNVSTCRGDVELLKNTIPPTFQKISIVAQLDNVCEDFSANQNLLTRKETYVAYKFSDKFICPIVCQGKVLKACAFLLWGYKVQAKINDVLHPPVAPNQGVSAVQDAENGSPNENHDDDGEVLNHAVSTKEKQIVDNASVKKVETKPGERGMTKLPTDTQTSPMSSNSPEDASKQSLLKPDNPELAENSLKKSSVVPKAKLGDSESPTKVESKEEVPNSKSEDGILSEAQPDGDHRFIVKTSATSTTAAVSSPISLSGSTLEDGKSQHKDESKMAPGESTADVQVQKSTLANAKGKLSEKVNKDIDSNKLNDGAAVAVGKESKAASQSGSSVPEGGDKNKLLPITTKVTAKDQSHTSEEVFVGTSVKNSAKNEDDDPPSDPESKSKPGTPGKDTTETKIIVENSAHEKPPSVTATKTTNLASEVSVSEVVLPSSDGVADKPVDDDKKDTDGQFDLENSDDPSDGEFDQPVEMNENSFPDFSNIDSDAVVSKTEKSKSEDEKIETNINADGTPPKTFHKIDVGFPEQEDTHFFFYFVTIVIFAIGGYVLFHNKQKIFALIIEGRHERRRRSGASYRKLETK